jgi:hypothetical protein
MDARDSERRAKIHTNAIKRERILLGDILNTIEVKQSLQKPNCVLDKSSTAKLMMSASSSISDQETGRCVSAQNFQVFDQKF